MDSNTLERREIMSIEDSSDKVSQAHKKVTDIEDLFYGIKKYADECIQGLIDDILINCRDAKKELKEWFFLTSSG